MQILDILEPIKPSIPSNDIAIGIDLGTTNSLVAIFKDHKVELLGNVIPSRIFSNHARLAIDYENRPYSISSIKSFLGKSPSDIGEEQFNSHDISCDNNQIYFDIAGNKYTAEELSAFILLKLKHQAETILGKDIEKAVITVPAYFDDAARQATINAAKLAGLEVLRLINEPTAAALAYGLDNQKEGIYAVYDFGGGTFDCTILQMKMGVFKVMSTAGDNNLGGDDIDRLLIKQFLEQNNLDNITDPAAFLNLKDQLRLIKEELCINEEITRAIQFNDNSYPFAISKQDFNNLIDPLLQKTFKLFHQAMNESNANIADLEGIIMVGGSSRIRAINDYFCKLTSAEMILDKQNPEELVAHGAAIAAYNLTNYCGKLLVDVVPLSLSIEVMGGLCEKIINKNTSIPISVKKSFTTFEDNQTGMIFHVVQGERELAKDCRSLVTFELKNIPPMKAGLAKIEIEFRIDADGILSITAKETTGNNSVQIDLNPSYGIKSSEINQMILDSYKNAEIDIQSRNKLEKILKVQNMITSLGKAIIDYPNILDEKSALETTILMDKLNQALKKEDMATIDEYFSEFSNIAEAFASKQLSSYFANQVKGKTMDDIKEKYLKVENGQN